MKFYSLCPLVTHILQLMVSSTPRRLPGGVQRENLARRAARLMVRIVIMRITIHLPHSHLHTLAPETRVTRKDDGLVGLKRVSIAEVATGHHIGQVVHQI